MCGIAGWYRRSPVEDGDTSLLRHMMQLMTHRGPDDEGICVDGPVRLGHRRLSIIDLEGGHQPMSSADGGCDIVFNGEIYNYRELRATLERDGHRFRTGSDTEVLLAVYQRQGINGLRLLNGMFAFALWDRRCETLFLVRDRLGIKPLYYSWAPDGALVFGSEIKSILAYPGIERRARLESISEYLSFRRVLGQETFFEGIERLEPGTFMEVSRGAAISRTWWRLPYEKYDTVTDHDLFEKTEGLLEAAVQRRMISDVPLGAFLSGGLDSSLVVAMMSRAASASVRTYAIGFPEPGYNELGHARHVAGACGTTHSEYEMGEADYVDLIPRLIGFRDEPLAVANEIALYELSRHLSRDITVVLSGEGADELFAGYGRIFRSPYDYERLNNARFMHGSAGPVLAEGIRERYGRASFADEIDHFLALYEYVPSHKQAALFNQDVWRQIRGAEQPRERIEQAMSGAGHLAHADRYLYFFQRFHLENLLRRVDMTTMANSVEARVPFVDHELIEHVYRIPFGHKLPWKSDVDRRRADRLTASSISERHDVPKAILKTIAGRYLPQEIIHRPKMGFPVPLDRYCGGPFVRTAREVLTDPVARRRGVFDAGTVDGWLDRLEAGAGHADALSVWMLVNLEMWFQLYIDHPFEPDRGRLEHESDHTRRGQRREALPADAQYTQEPA